MPRYWDSNHGARWPQLEEELDTAWVSEVGVVVVPGQTNWAAVLYPTPIFLPPSGSPPAAA